MAGTTVMQSSLTLFLDQLIDYAGMFPPAVLDLETSVARYADYLDGENGWMLGRLVLPVENLPALNHRSDFRYSVIVSPEQLTSRQESLPAFREGVELVETRAPEGTISQADYLDFLLQVQRWVRRADLHAVRLFVEAEDPAGFCLAIAALPGEIGRKMDIGLKLRCGGATREMIPSVGKIAEAIQLACHHDIPIKFTAGMHHPLYRIDRGTGEVQHGFVNIFTAALLYWSEQLVGKPLLDCLGDEAPQNFHFEREYLSWRGIEVREAEIKRLRQSRLISFGSCSFTEPIEGLRTLGFLNTSGG